MGTVGWLQDRPRSADKAGKAFWDWSGIHLTTRLDGLVSIRLTILLNNKIKSTVLILALGWLGAPGSRAQEEEAPRRAARFEFVQMGADYEAFMIGSALLFVDARLKAVEAAAHADGLETAPVPPRDSKGFYTQSSFHLLRRQVPGLVRRLDLAAIFGGAALAHSQESAAIHSQQPDLIELRTNDCGVSVVLNNRALDQFTLRLDVKFLPLSATVNGTNFPVLTTGEIPGFPEGQRGVDWCVSKRVEVDGPAGGKFVQQLQGRFPVSRSLSLTDATYDFTKVIDFETGFTFTCRNSLRCLVELKDGFLSFGGGRKDDTIAFQGSTNRVQLQDRPYLAIAESGRQIQAAVASGRLPFRQSLIHPKAIYEQLKPGPNPYSVGFKNPQKPYRFSEDGNAVWIVFQSTGTGEELEVEADANGPTGRARFEGQPVRLPIFQPAFQED